MQLTVEQLCAATGAKPANAALYLAHINSLKDKYAADTAARLAAFLGQVAHESGRFSAVEENLRYSAEALCRVWPSRFHNGDARQLLNGRRPAADFANKPQAIANYVYANRGGNGPENSGEGWKYRGRGLIQTTLKNNYAQTGIALGLDLINTPELLLQPVHAVQSALYYWQSRGCQYLADANDLLTLSRRINGGTNGLAERIELTNRARAVFGLAPISSEKLS
ncbi:glycoside hydrolase family 19 protein [Parvibium lacunae]|uniref:Glycoside hydrolase family 19 protein n=1 Tax=Parvibium lacunae TaxID=1888893 RepID=A0A368L8Z6_9BURK|nr:glycoside hydrolase family 19 protein [Parvibium lacunae]RCS59709.1 glycoside hydrolase family 19 protein [Parvibium lacunae]